MNSQQDIATINASMKWLLILDAPATLLLGLGLYGRFVQDDLFIPQLGNPVIANGLLVVGGAMTMFIMARMIKLLGRRNALQAGGTNHGN